jgi:hypothetical protein
MHNQTECFNNQSVAHLSSLLTRELCEMHRPEIADFVREGEIVIDGTQISLVLPANVITPANHKLATWLAALLLRATYRAGIQAENVAIISPADLAPYSEG